MDGFSQDKFSFVFKPACRCVKSFMTCRNLLTLAPLFILLGMFISHSDASPLKQHPQNSFAEQYSELAILLVKVRDTHSALAHKPMIESEIKLLQRNQSSGREFFDSLSDKDKKLFIRRFQNNRFHCSEVTQVMRERRRILLDPVLSEVLGETLANIP